MAHAFVIAGVAEAGKALVAGKAAFEHREDTMKRMGRPLYLGIGRVVKGMDVVEKIKGVPTGTAGMHQNVPSTPVVIESVKLVDAPKK